MKKWLFSLLSLVALTTACGRPAPSESQKNSENTSSQTKRTKEEKSESKSAASSEQEESSKKEAADEAELDGSLVTQSAQTFYQRHPGAKITKVIAKKNARSGPVTVIGGTNDESFKLVIEGDHKTVKTDVKLDDHNADFNAGGVPQDDIGRLTDLSHRATESVGRGEAFKWILIRKNGSFNWKVLVSDHQRVRSVLINEDATKVLSSH